VPPVSDQTLAREAARQLDVMRDGAVAFHGEEELRPRLIVALKEQRPLRIKLGMDPSAPDLHIGHTVVLNKLKRIQELGHIPIFLIGDFTARIGDPSGRDDEREFLDEGRLEANLGRLKDQLGRVMDVSDPERGLVVDNYEWLRQIGFVEMLRDGATPRLISALRTFFARSSARCLGDGLQLLVVVSSDPSAWPMTVSSSSGTLTSSRASLSSSAALFADTTAEPLAK